MRLLQELQQCQPTTKFSCTKFDHKCLVDIPVVGAGPFCLFRGGARIIKGGSPAGGFPDEGSILAAALTVSGWSLRDLGFMSWAKGRSLCDWAGLGN